MALDPFLLDVVVCPETRANLALAPPALLDRLNAAIDAGKLHNRAGLRVAERLEAALVRSDQAVCYPVRGDTPFLLVEEQIRLEQLG